MFGDEICTNIFEWFLKKEAKQELLSKHFQYESQNISENLSNFIDMEQRSNFELHPSCANAYCAC